MLLILVLVDQPKIQFSDLYWQLSLACHNGKKAIRQAFADRFVFIGTPLAPSITMSSQNSGSKGAALVTGAAQGIGRAIALRLAADGFDVGVNDIASKAAQLDKVKQEIIAAGRRSAVFCADVSVDSEVKDMVAGVVAALGGLDVVSAVFALTAVHLPSAHWIRWSPMRGSAKRAASLLDVSPAEWDRTFEINVRGMFLCYQYAAKQMILQGRGGRIIGATSGAGKQGNAMMPDYCSSKFAVRGLTQSAACEFGKHKITVNAYAPGAVITPMTEQFAPLANMSQEDFFAMQAKMAATGVNPTTDDIATIVSFLASKEAGFITGQSHGTFL
ncbi:L-2,3-butanediol dehydrogenase [Mycena venus]|uniref:L-2,3-butanediol dehydrogenase n=1 Tax=Mycena venus TaxID=2733690 RepID=A0A8H7CNX9_9AGAR|nr:L-2,3-butanediol dehydrogenase [Mycena venus]